MLEIKRGKIMDIIWNCRQCDIDLQGEEQVISHKKDTGHKLISQKRIGEKINQLESDK